jgi:hypothetical protein
LLAIDRGVAMPVVSQLDSDFAFVGADETAAAAPTGDPLGPLADLPGPGETPGTWVGHGFNAIWRPHPLASGHDRFLELNLTDDTIVFTRIKGEIPNRGLDMPNINMQGITYMQQINEAGNPAAGLHIEPGIWALVPQTSNPSEPQTVVRMASIPHGTVINAQGVFQVVEGGPQTIPNNNILPFFFNTSAPTNAQFDQVALTFGELDLSIPTPFRQEPSGISQADLQKIVKNPNSVLQTALQESLNGTSMTSRTFLHISTTNSVIKGGGGTANTAFLTSSTNPQVGNARATQVQATFWIETIAGTGGQPAKLQLQYTQLVMLDFNGIHWPHVTVGTLVKQ